VHHQKSSMVWITFSYSAKHGYTGWMIFHTALWCSWGHIYKFLQLSPPLLHDLKYGKLQPFLFLTGSEPWKVGSRRVYAVPRDRSWIVKSKSKKRAHHIVIDSDSDSEADFLPQKKKNTCAVACAEVNSLKNEVMVMKDQMHRLFQIDRRMKIPVALQTILQDTFKCHICQTTPICPPVIFARCCKSYRMWSLYWHMVQGWRWNITKLSTMPHGESTTGDDEAAWPRWVS